MTRGVPLLGYRMRTCIQCDELFDPTKKEITHEQYHWDKECKMYEWLEYVCGCKNIRAKIEQKLGLDTEEKQDKYYDDQPDCTCQKKKFVWICQDCRANSCS